jgi:hypothetical protein
VTDAWIVKPARIAAASDDRRGSRHRSPKPFPDGSSRRMSVLLHARAENRPFDGTRPSLSLSLPMYRGEPASAHSLRFLGMAGWRSRHASSARPRSRADGHVPPFSWLRVTANDPGWDRSGTPRCARGPADPGYADSFAAPEKTFPYADPPLSSSTTHPMTPRGSAISVARCRSIEAHTLQTVPPVPGSCSLLPGTSFLRNVTKLAAPPQPDQTCWPPVLVSTTGRGAALFFGDGLSPDEVLPRRERLPGVPGAALLRPRRLRPGRTS